MKNKVSISFIKQGLKVSFVNVVALKILFKSFQNALDAAIKLLIQQLLYNLFF